VSIIVNDVKTGVSTMPRDKSDRYLSSGLAASGIKVA